MSDALPAALAPQLIADIGRVATATLTFQLQQRGIRNAFLPGLRPLHPGKRMIGRARTLRYVAVREDKVASLQKKFGGTNAQKHIVEHIESGDVLVMEARGVADAATIGDILATRLHVLGGAGIVTDGALRDTPAIEEIGVPVYFQSSHGATLGRQHMPFSVDEPVTCAGAFVEPGDVLVGDGEGVVVIPRDLVEEVVADALVQEARETYALERVAAGESVIGLFPLAAEREDDFEAWLAQQTQQPDT